MGFLGEKDMFCRLPICSFRFTCSRSRGQIRFCSSSRPLSITTTSAPLFLRPLSHNTTSSHLQTFHAWAKSLAFSSSHPDPPHLIRELTWLLQDATSDPHTSFLQLGTTHPIWRVPLRVELKELYVLWKARVEERRPLQYIVGCEHWRDLILVVRDGVLIPRPETEMMVDFVKEIDGSESGLWADLGTGSGAIAVAIGKMLGEDGKVFAVDLSQTAVEVAKINVERYGLKDKVEVRHGSWFEPLEDVVGKLTGVVSNPPYIPSKHIPGLQVEVGKHEPQLALDGGEDGLHHLLHLCEGCLSVLKSGGFFGFETNGDEHSELIAGLMKTRWSGQFRDVKVIADFAGIKRFVTGFKM